MSSKSVKPSSVVPETVLLPGEQLMVPDENITIRLSAFVGNSDAAADDGFGKDGVVVAVEFVTSTLVAIVIPLVVLVLLELAVTGSVSLIVGDTTLLLVMSCVVELTVVDTICPSISRMLTTNNNAVNARNDMLNMIVSTQ